MIRYLFLFLSAAITTALCIILDTTLLLKAPLGKLLSPQEGIWQNAEAVDCNYSADLHFNTLEGNVSVYLDDRLVPHIFAEKENDAYFVQGFLHAKFRLWQMELQTLAAAGRASEVVGEVAVTHDREFRRLGMVYAAEKSLAEMEKDPETKMSCDAYTAGVNAYISQLTKSSLPLEYKLLGYQPEKWSNLKSALFLKYMSFDLAGHENDFEMTNAKSFFNKKDFDKLFPAFQDSADPIIPKGTILPEAKIKPIVPAYADSIYMNFIKDSVSVVESEKPNPENGSNNWAVAASKTKNGAPILCNDPHLGLNFPSLWFEIQISTPNFNAYGVSFPGSPGVIIGYNDYVAFGFTNGGRDVRDYYKVHFKDASKQEYWFDSTWLKTDLRVERIKIAGKPDLLDTVAYTIFGPVMYDASFNGKAAAQMATNNGFAVKWIAHNSTNELKLFYLLNRAKNYDDYLAATKYLKTPGQNCVFACKNGDISIRTQGNFPAKWKGQGDFVMPGFDSSYLWQGMIPEDETPFQYNPERGFVSSANQRPVDTAYPYYLGREYPSSRGVIVNRNLSKMQQITVQDMMSLQTNNYDVFAEMALPIFLKNILLENLNTQEKKYYSILSQWNKSNEANEIAPTIFDLTWYTFYHEVYDDEYMHAPKNTMHPFESTLLEAVLKDSAYSFIDNINTPATDTLKQIVTIAFKKAIDSASKLEAEHKIKWCLYKGTHINHLLKLPAFSSDNLTIGGGKHAINATTKDHGPSWRMIVSLTAKTEAYGIFPGGQSGNPGSKYYDNTVSDWSDGNYYNLWMMTSNEKNDKRIKWKMNFSKN